MGEVFTGLMQAVGAADKVFEFIDRQSQMPLDIGTYDPIKVDGKIEFKNVSFYYPSRPGKWPGKVLITTLWVQIIWFCPTWHWNFPLEKWQLLLAHLEVESLQLLLFFVDFMTGITAINNVFSP